MMHSIMSEPKLPKNRPATPVTDASTRETYDRFAEAYTKRYYETRALDAEMDGFLTHLPPAPTILDAGCGPGHQSRYFNAHGARSIGIDFSEPMLVEGRRRDPGVSLVCGDLQAVPVATASIDGVWARASLIHMDNDAVARALVEFRRVLKPAEVLYTAVREG